MQEQFFLCFDDEAKRHVEKVARVMKVKATSKEYAAIDPVYGFFLCDLRALCGEIFFF